MVSMFHSRETIEEDDLVIIFMVGTLPSSPSVR